jgi:hypothetical protein
MNKRCRSVCFTLNNYTPEEVKHLEDGPFKFIVFQRERGLEGTPHLQGFCQMGNPTAFSTWKRLISPRAHLETPRGTARQNYEYCTKVETREGGTVPFERGDIPNPGERTDIAGIVGLAKDHTKRLRDIVDADGETYLRYYKGIDRVRSIFSEPRRFQTEVFWFYGSTGTGKSKLADEMAPDAYWKPNDKWFDGYDPIEHPDIIIDDFRADFHKFNFVLRLFDRYPMQVEIKGGTVNFRASRVFVTTSKHPRETWQGRTEEAMDQLLRRLKVVVEFLPGGIRRFDKGGPCDLEGSGIVEPALARRRLRSSEEEAVDRVEHVDGLSASQFFANEPRIGGPIVDDNEDWDELMRELDSRQHNFSQVSDNDFLNDLELI